jgi:hypothetical protein
MFSLFTTFCTALFTTNGHDVLEGAARLPLS